MTKQHLLKISLISFICGAVSCAISYFFYHFVTDDGITFTWHPEAGKPFVSEMLGDLSVLFFFAAALFLIISLVVFDSEKKATPDNESGISNDN